MQANKELINAFRSSAERLRQDPDSWNWETYESCNCGILAQELGLPAKTLATAGNAYTDWGTFGHAWYETKGSSNVRSNCPITNRSISEVIDTLFQYGIEPHDLQEIENIVTHDGVSKKDFAVAELIDYFLNKADQLESQLLNQSVKCKNDTKQTVSLGGE